MKKKNWKILLGMLLVAALSLGFTACGGDDDEEDNPGVEGRSLVGKWNIAHWQRLVNGEWVDEKQESPYDMIVFTSDGKMEYWEYDGTTSENNKDERVWGNYYYHEDGQGTWSVSGGKYTFSPGVELLEYDGDSKARLKVNWGKKTYIYYLERAE